MREFTERRSADTPDEIWLCEHPPVYTQGQAGKAEHVLDAHGIPVVQTNRGGQVAYHGLALNVAMDLSPFSGINPCGYAGLQTVDLATLGVRTDWTTAAQRLGDRLVSHLS